MPTIEMSPGLKTLIEQLAGSYPSDPTNETLPNFVAELKPEEIGELFTNIFALFRNAVDTEHEKSLLAHPYGVTPQISRETTQLGFIAEALLRYLDAAGVEMSFAARSAAIEGYMAQNPHCKKALLNYSSESDGYYRFYTNVAWSDKPAIYLVFIGSSAKLILRNGSGMSVTLDIRDVYLTEIRY